MYTEGQRLIAISQSVRLHGCAKEQTLIKQHTAVHSMYLAICSVPTTDVYSLYTHIVKQAQGCARMVAHGFS